MVPVQIPEFVCFSKVNHGFFSFSLFVVSRTEVLNHSHTRSNFFYGRYFFLEIAEDEVAEAAERARKKSRKNSSATPTSSSASRGTIFGDLASMKTRKTNKPNLSSARRLTPKMSRKRVLNTPNGGSSKGLSTQVSAPELHTTDFDFGAVAPPRKKPRQVRFCLYCCQQCVFGFQ